MGMADGYAQATGKPSFVNLHTAGEMVSIGLSILVATAVATLTPKLLRRHQSGGPAPMTAT